MVRKKQQNPYHGTKECIDTMENTTPLVANIFSMPQRPFPPLLRFALIVNKSEDPEGTKNKILEEGIKYELTQGDEIQRSLRDMSVLELRTALKDIGLKVNGKKQDLVNRLVGAQSTRGKDRNSRRESKTQKIKGSATPPSPPSTTSPAPTEPVKLEETNGKPTAKHESSNLNSANAEKEVEVKESEETKAEPEQNGEIPSVPEENEIKEEEAEDEYEDEDNEASESSSPYAKLKVMELRTELRKRGLNTAGRKDELIDRLEADTTNSGKSTSPSDGQEKLESSAIDAAQAPSDSSPSSPTSESSPSSPSAVATTPITPPVSPPPLAAKSSPSKSSKRGDRELNSLVQLPDQKGKRRVINPLGNNVDSEEEEELSDAVEDDDTDEYDDAESRRKKKVEGPKSTKGSKGKGGRRDAISMRTAKRRRRDF